MNDSIKISIIIPVYHVADIIEDTLKSIQNQTFENYEVLLIDDGSKDETAEVIERCIADDDRFHYVYKENQGPAAARNDGLKLAKGDFILFVDSDDLLAPNALTVMYQAAQSENADLVTGSTKRFNQKQEWFIDAHITENVIKPGAKTFEENPELVYSIGPCAKLYKKELVEDIRFLEEIKYGEDQPFVLETLIRAQKIYTVDEVVYFYRLRDGENKSLTQSISQNPIRILDSILQFLDVAKKLFNAYGSSQNVQLSYYNRVVKIEISDAIGGVFTGNKTKRHEFFQKLGNWLYALPEAIFYQMDAVPFVFVNRTIGFALGMDKHTKETYQAILQYIFKHSSEESLKVVREASEYYRAALSIVEQGSFRNANRLAVRQFIRQKFDTNKLVMRIGRQLVFRFGKLLPVKKGSIVFGTERSDVLSGNLKAIYDCMSEQEKKRVVLLLKKSPSWKHTLHIFATLARAETIVIDDYYNKIYSLSFKKEVKVIQTWHAAGAFKKFGFSALFASDSETEEFEKRAHSSYTDVLVSSENLISEYSEAFRVAPSKVKPIGVPRTDLFFNEEKIRTLKGHLYQKYPVLKKKKAILYAPTFRGGAGHRMNFKMQLDALKMKKALGDEYVLILKFHPVVKNVAMNLAEQDEFILDLSDEKDINPIMLVSDSLITDYSSVIFEYSLLNRPMYFFADDLENYHDERGFYFPYEEMVPGAIYQESDTLIRDIQNEQFDYEKLNRFKEKFVDALDGKSTERFITQYVRHKE